MYSAYGSDGEIVLVFGLEVVVVGGAACGTLDDFSVGIIFIGVLIIGLLVTADDVAWETIASEDDEDE